MTVGKKLARGLVICIFLTTLGCGGREVPQLGYVSGTVTMDGKPLGNVVVQFHPQSKDGGRASMGMTDSEGKYVLTYVADEKGTKLGPNRVSISTNWPGGEPGEGESETIPLKYMGRDSILTGTVVEGDNTFDFKLESK